MFASLTRKNIIKLVGFIIYSIWNLLLIRLIYNKKRFIYNKGFNYNQNQIQLVYETLHLFNSFKQIKFQKSFYY